MHNLRPTCEFFVTRRFAAENIKYIFSHTAGTCRNIATFAMFLECCNIAAILL